MTKVRVISERNITEQFLKCYKNLPCLWNRTDPQYSNWKERKRALLVLLTLLRKYYCKASLASVRSKLENMRTSYKRERKKIRQSQSIGEIHKPRLWYYPYMTFLDENPNSPADDKDTIAGTGDVTEEPTRKRGRTVAAPTGEASALGNEETIELFENILCSAADKNPANAFASSIGAQLEELPKLQRCLAEKLMGEIMCYAKLGCLNLNSSIDLKLDLSDSSQYLSKYVAPRCSYSPATSLGCSTPSPGLCQSPSLLEPSEQLTEFPEPVTPEKSSQSHQLKIHPQRLQTSESQNFSQRRLARSYQPSSLRIISNQQIRPPDNPLHSPHHGQHDHHQTASCSNSLVNSLPFPRYETSRPQSPEYTPHSPEYNPSSPDYRPNSPVCCSSQSPRYVTSADTKSLVNTSKSSNFGPSRPQSPVYTIHSPEYNPSSPDYRPNSPVYCSSQSPRYVTSADPKRS